MPALRNFGVLALLLGAGTSLASDGPDMLLNTPGGPEWELHCDPLPARLCLARAANVWLWVEHRMTGHHITRLAVTPTSVGARISILVGDRLRDAPGLLTQPVNEEMLKALSPASAELVVSTPGGAAARFPVGGAHLAASAILWWYDTYHTEIGKWPGPELATPEAPPLERYQSEERRRGSAPEIYLPATKPQIQFAIRAQGGTPPMARDR